MLKIAWSPIYEHRLPAKHRFPMEKYALLPEQLLYEGTVEDANFFQPMSLKEKYIVNTHNKDYWQKLKTQMLSRKEIRATGFPLSPGLVEREVTIAQGTLRGSEYALQYGISMNIAGGTHHAFTNKGEGFCLLNDMAIASNYLLEKQLAKKILIIDLDVHQGNGTAEIFRQQTQVLTFSMHGAKNYPLRKEKSNLDIGLPDATNDNFYLQTLRNELLRLIDNFEPDFAFFQSGVDVLATDKLGRLALSRQGCRERDKFVLETCKRNNIPLFVSMGGGYSPKIADILEAHANTYRLAQEIYF